MDQQKLEKIFGILRKIHKAHWKTPKLPLDKKLTFRIGGEPWVAELIIDNEKIEYVVNSELPEKFKKKTQEYKKEFKTNIESL